MKLRGEELLLHGVADVSCRAVVVVPARNEEASLPTTLNSLARQVDLRGEPLSLRSFEILLLLNNCTDGSAERTMRWQLAHPEIAIHCFKREFTAGEAHIGTARRLLMNTAWSRLQGARGTCAILSTDADSYVANDWIAQNLWAVEHGADAVGGVVDLIREDFEALSGPVRKAYISDRRYQSLMAELEDLFDPQQGDACPRHLEHYGASLACTPEIYARVGGTPAVAELEDVAFVDRLRRVDAILRHEPKVIVTTSGRLNGRVMSGLSEQLRHWQLLHDAGEPQCVPTFTWLKHRFSILRSLRRYFAGGEDADLKGWSHVQRREFRRVRRRCDGVGEFLSQVDCDLLIENTFAGERMGTIDTVNATIATFLASTGTLRATEAAATRSSPRSTAVSLSTLEDVDAVLISSNT